MEVKYQTTVITVESKITNLSKNDETILTDYCKLYSTIERNLFNDLTNHPELRKQFNDLQKHYSKKYNIQVRIFKSIWINILARIDSIKSNNKNYKDNRKNRIKKLQGKLTRCKDDSYKYHIKNKINRLKQLNDNPVNISSVWGSRKYYHKQWNHDNHTEWLKQWRVRRDNNLLLIGSSDERFGNGLCQLESLNSLRLTLPYGFNDKHLYLEVDFDKNKKLYSYLRGAIVNSKALTIRVFQYSKNNQWYVQISFKLTNSCRDYDNGTIGIDINYNLICSCLVDKFGTQRGFTNYYFEVDDNNKDRNKQVLSDIANSIVSQALQDNKTITIEKIDLKKIAKTKKVSLVCYRLFISLLRSRCVKEGVLLLEVDPRYTSVIGGLKYSKRLGISRHSSAAYTVGRRGLNYIERIPVGYTCLLHRGEKNKSLLSRWYFLNKRLQTVSPEEKSRYIASIYVRSNDM